MLSDIVMKPEDPEEKARHATAVAFMLATEESDFADHDPHYDSDEDPYDPYEDAESHPYDPDDPDQTAPWGGGGLWNDQYGIMHVLKASQGIVRILGRDEIKLGMTCDVEYGYARQGVEVEIVGMNPTDKRLVTVERTDNKAWEHHKSHTRIVRP